MVEQAGPLSGAGGDFLLQILAGLTVAVLSFLLGLNRGKTINNTYNDHSVTSIHATILVASSAAMAASTNELKSRAQALRDLIHELLGPVLDVAKGITPSLKALDEALKGEKKVEAKATVAPPGPACGCGKPEACTCKSTATGAPVTVNQVYIGGVAVTPPAACGCTGTHKPECGHNAAAPKPDPQSAPKPETQAMSGPEQVEALAKAVRQFHDHWLDSPARIRELKAARSALSRRPTASRARSHGQGH